MRTAGNSRLQCVVTAGSDGVWYNKRRAVTLMAKQTGMEVTSTDDCEQCSRLEEAFPAVSGTHGCNIRIRGPLQLEMCVHESQVPTMGTFFLERCDGLT